MRAAGVLIVAAALVGGAACEPPEPEVRPQARVFVDTDMPVPRLADRLRLEVLRPDAEGRLVPCGEACARTELLGQAGDGGVPDLDFPISFGVAPPSDGGRVFVRARLFPTGRTNAQGPLPQDTIDAIVEVAFGGPGGPILDQELFLAAACAGQPAEPRVDGLSCVDGERRPIGPAPLVRAPFESRVGTFRESYTRGCAGELRPDTGLHDGEVCVSGGTFWMGDERHRALGRFWDPVPEHLVTVSPVRLDAYEYTVGRYRALLASGRAPPAALAGVRARDPGSIAWRFCNYTADPDPEVREQDAQPLNCVTFSAARAICEAEGGRLPTEAEWEWAAGNREAESLYPHGDDVPLFRDGNYRDEEGMWQRRCALRPNPDGSLPPSEPCTLPVGTVRLPANRSAPVGGMADVSIDGVYDLTGNVSEWTADQYQLYTQHCWEPGRYGPDPLCDPPFEAEEMVYGRTARGGDATQDGYYWMVITTRRVDTHRFLAPTRGFRCARPDEP